MQNPETPIHFIDFEGCRRTGIVEFGLATLQKGSIVATHTGLCRSRAAITAQDSHIHGLRDRDTETAQPFEIHWELFSNARRSGFFAAHHASVEDGLLRDVWPFPSGHFEWGPWIDTRAIYASVFPQLNGHQLSGLIDVFGLQAQLDAMARQHCPPTRCRYHCALYDALASAVLLLHLASIDQFEHMAFDWLLVHSKPSGKSRSEGLQRELF